ncbi:MAG TPA: ABC transporter substrate-binding protein [bacterium]|jgi:NitT/TauT family transport system substrate-binding protein|nr:ABC transporter substrate-binding protein [bacterium]
MRAVLTLVVLGALLQAGTPVAARAVPLTPVHVRFFPLLFEAPVFIAIEEGYFAAQGIEVRFEEIRDTSLVWPAMMAGQLDVQVGQTNAGLFEAMRRGVKLRIVADASHATPEDNSVTFMVRQDLIDSGRFRALKDLRGMRITLASRGGIGEWILQQILSNRALLTERDVQIQQVPPPLVADAFRAKTIDAATTAEPFVTRLEALGIARTVVRIHEVLPRAQLAVVIYGPGFLSRNPGLGQRFMNAYLQGAQRYAAGKTDRNIAIIQKYTREDPALLRRMPWPPIHPDGHINTESILQFQSWLVRQGYLESVVGSDRFLDASFARRANQSLKKAP